MINKMRMNRIRTFVRKVEHAIQNMNKTEALAAFLQAQPEIMKGVTRGILHRNTAARKISRLSARLRKIA